MGSISISRFDKSILWNIVTVSTLRMIKEHPVQYICKYIEDYVVCEKILRYLCRDWPHISRVYCGSTKLSIIGGTIWESYF